MIWFSANRSFAQRQVTLQVLYTKSVKRLLQFGVLLLGLAAVLTPLMEFFDNWDPPGPPSNDTELGVFGLILILCLVLLVSRLIATLDRLIETGAVFRLQPIPLMWLEASRRIASAVVPHSSPPLRI